jgi:octaprenyl-diphosphate synthase
MERGTSQERELMRHAIVNGEVERLPDIVTIVRRTGALEATRQVARSEASKARDCLEALGASDARDALIELTLRSVERSS